MGWECPRCRACFAPSVPVCPRCWEETVAPAVAAEGGPLDLWGVLPPPFRQCTPYVQGLESIWLLV